MKEKFIVGLVLKKLRERKKVGLNELSREIGINQSYLSKIENGKKVCSEQAADKILTFFNKDIKWLNNEIEKRGSDYITPESYTVIFGQVNDANWKAEVKKDIPYYQKAYYKLHARKYAEANPDDIDVNSPFDLFFFNRKLKSAEIEHYLNSRFKDLIEANYFKPKVIDDLAAVYLKEMEKYESSEWHRRLDHVKKVYKLLQDVQKFDLAVGRDDIFFNLREFRQNYESYLETVLTYDEFLFVTRSKDGRGKTNKTIKDDEEYLGNYIQPATLQTNPVKYKNDLFKAFANQIISNKIQTNIYNKRNDIISSQEIILSLILCWELRILTPDHDIDGKSQEHIEVNDLDLSKFHSETDANTSIIKKSVDDYQKKHRYFIKIANTYRKVLTSEHQKK